MTTKIKAEKSCLSWEGTCQALYNILSSDINLKTASLEFNIDETGLRVRHTGDIISGCVPKTYLIPRP